tara:strand:- start:620 stop:913 length:294 start_codon:yes stop_codon:yes gene_type:complete
MKEYAEQNCNFYKEELLKLQNLDTTNYSESDVNIIVNKMKFYAYLIDIYSMESQVEWLYLPDKKIKMESISDLIHFENLYGSTIYEKKEYKEQVEKN